MAKNAAPYDADLERFKREDKEWTPQRFITLLFVTLTISIATIYAISSLYYGDWTWHPLAWDPAHEAMPSD